MALDARARVTYIYVLKDPRDGRVRYVGKSNDPKKRLRWRIAQARGGMEEPHSSAWIKSVLDAGYRPEVIILETVNLTDWRDAEQRWIKHFRDNGMQLTNHAAGGDGPNGRVMPVAERIARRKSGRKTWETRRRLYGPSGVIDPSNDARGANLVRHIRRNGAWNKGKKMPAGHGANLASYVKENGPWNRGLTKIDAPQLRRSRAVKTKISRGLRRAYTEGRR